MKHSCSGHRRSGFLAVLVWVMGMSPVAVAGGDPCSTGSDAECLEWLIAQGSERATGFPMELLEDVCERAKPALCAEFARRKLETGQLPENELVVVNGALERACEHGVQEACVQLALHLEAGKGGLRSEEKALSLFENACAQHNALACLNLAWAFQNGALGQRRNRVKMADYAEQSCDLGHAAGCLLLGLCFQEGDGRKGDPEEANSLFVMACEGGEMAACGHYGANLVAGNGVPGNREKGLRLLEIACNEGDRWACKTAKKLQKPNPRATPRLPNLPRRPQ